MIENGTIVLPLFLIESSTAVICHANYGPPPNDLFMKCKAGAQKRWGYLNLELAHLIIPNTIKVGALDWVSRTLVRDSSGRTSKHSSEELLVYLLHCHWQSWTIYWRSWTSGFPAYLLLANYLRRYYMSKPEVPSRPVFVCFDACVSRYRDKEGKETLRYERPLCLFFTYKLLGKCVGVTQFLAELWSPSYGNSCKFWYDRAE